MKRLSQALVLAALVLSPAFSSSGESDLAATLAEWRKGVWILQDGSYAVYTDNHYFVLVVSAMVTTANIYCGASQVRFHDKGMARRQVHRVLGRGSQEQRRSLGSDPGRQESRATDCFGV